MTDDELRLLMRRAKRLAHAVARDVGRPWLADELEGAALEGLARAVATYEDGHGVEVHIWCRYRMHNTTWDAVRNWLGRRGPKPLAGREADALEAAALQPCRGFSPEQRALDDDELRDVLTAIGRLSPCVRDAVLARPRGETLNDVAARWGLTASRICQIRGEALRWLQLGACVDCAEPLPRRGGARSEPGGRCRRCSTALVAA